VLYAKAIVNPAAGGFSAVRAWPAISRELHESGMAIEYEYAQGERHAEELAREASGAGCRYLIAVGGDGTASAVANGILSSGASTEAILGIVPTGTASSFARSLGIPTDYAGACSRLARRRSLCVDVGVVEWMHEGEPLRRFFLNQLGVGFGAAVIEAAGAMRVRAGPRVSYALHVLAGTRCIFSYRNRLLALRSSGLTVEGRICALVVANGRYLGGSMLVAPGAQLDDGLLDLLVVGNLGSLGRLAMWPTLYRGGHVTHRKVVLTRTQSVRIESGERVPVEADGEFLGHCPVSVSVMPSTLSVVV